MSIRNHSGQRPIEVISKYGKCIELVSMDKYYNNISIGLYLKDDVFTVWSFDSSKGSKDRIKQIRDQLVKLGGMIPVGETDNQVKFECSNIHERPIKFLLNQAVGKAPDYSPPSDILTIKDSKSDLHIFVEKNYDSNINSYRVIVKGEARNPAMRLRMIVAGFIKYGEMQKISDDVIAFPCNQFHDGLIRVLLPYSRNISSVESMMAAEDLRGQMTTGTLGFSQV
ncbi:MAG: hypothetical protein CL733_04860 [Chloroflexi bacterium]|nr:hypothetical protein [Chloroflexota bacterium]|tara:strand:- start:656 stop:1330 length:675 start_codon:yes stop_codon:yes gene_type:complete